MELVASGREGMGLVLKVRDASRAFSEKHAGIVGEARGQSSKYSNKCDNLSSGSGCMLLDLPFQLFGVAPWKFP